MGGGCAAIHHAKRPVDGGERRVASFYGVPAAAAGNSFERISLASLPRAGILTQPWLLATLSNPNESSPIHRGQWVRERILCHELPPPPPDIPELPPIEDDLSNRERFALHTSEPACARLPLSDRRNRVRLEEFDGIGRYRDSASLDTSGSLTATTDIDGPFSGGVELAQRLASSAQVRACAVNQAFRYMVAREIEPEDACTIQDLQDRFEASGGDLRELMVQLAASETFRTYGGAAQ